jgi:hypothetical protein
MDDGVVSAKTVAEAGENCVPSLGAW